MFVLTRFYCVNLKNYNFNSRSGSIVEATGLGFSMEEYGAKFIDLLNSLYWRAMGAIIGVCSYIS